MTLPLRIDLAEKLTLFHDQWSPRIIGELNSQHVKLAKLDGPFIWHQHAEEDELFLVLSGRLAIHFRDGVVDLTAGQMVIVPKGVEHKPVADGEVAVLLFEPATTRHTGETTSERTVHDLEWI